MISVLKKIFIAFLGFLLILVMLLGFLLSFPETYLNDRNLKILLSYLPETKLDWSSLEFRVDSVSFLKKRIWIESQNLKYRQKTEETKISVDLPHVLLAFEYDLLELKLKSIGPVQIDKGQLHFQKLRDVENDEAFSWPAFDLKLPAYLADTDFYPININLDSLVYSSPDQTLQGPVSLELRTENYQITELLINSELSNKKNQNLELKLKLLTADSLASDLWKLKTHIVFEDQKIKTKTTFDWDRENSRYKISGKVLLNESQSDYSLTGRYTEDLITINLGVQALNIHPALKKISLSDCEFKLRKISEYSNDGQLQYDCPLTINLAQLKAELTKSYIYESPGVLNGRLAGDFSTFFDPDPSHLLKGQTHFKLTAIKDKILNTNFSFNMNLNGVPSEYPKNWDIISNFNLNLLISDFQKLVELLEGSEFAVWAPFHVFRGKTEINIEGESNSLFNKATIPFEMTSRLKSKEQVLEVDSSSIAELDIENSKINRVFLKGDLVLSEVVLQLPHINPISFPRLFPDTRIQLSQSPKKEKIKLPFEYDFKVKTNKEKPLKLKYYLAKKEVPIHLDLSLKNESLKGDVKIDQFPLEFFNRQASVNYLNLILEDDDPIEVDGRVEMEYSDYKILLKILGTAENPTLVFESDPPLSQENIYAVLLYGEPYEKLEADEASSTTDATAAAADKAISLVNLFALSSTPIQKIGYNPVSKEFSAKVKLAKGTSLNLGSSEESSQVGIQRQLGKGWVIRTYYEDAKGDDSNDKNNGTALLEWNKRY